MSKSFLPRDDKPVLVMSIVSFVVFVFFCIVFRLPIIDDDLLCLCPEIDRTPSMERLIELLDVVTGDILLATCHEVSLHYIRERIDEDIERLSILSSVSFFVWFDCLLERMDDLGRLARIAEDE